MDELKRAGKIAKEIITWGAKLIKPGKNILEVCKEIENKVIKKGGSLAFPVNISINHIAAHDTPSYNDERIFEEKDVVKLDIGVHIDGFIGDIATTIDLSGEYGKLVEASEKALEAAISEIKAGKKVCDIETTIQKTIEKFGFKPVENLGGHEIRQYILHSGLSIMNKNTRNQTLLEEGMIIAIEPFVTNGTGRVVEGVYTEIFSLVSIGTPRSKHARTILDYIIKQYKTLPFAERWIIEQFGVFSTRVGLKELAEKGLLRTYPILHDKKGSTVTQSEKTVIVTKDGCEVIT